MAHAMRIDSLKFARKLEAAGLDRKAAEAIAEGVSEVDVSDLATKTDIADLRSATKTDIAELRSATKADIAELRSATQADIAELRQEIGSLRAATKSDIAELRSEIVSLRGATKADIAELRAELFRQLWIMAAGIVALTFTLSKLFP